MTHPFTPVYLPHSPISGHLPLHCAARVDGRPCGRTAEDPTHQRAADPAEVR